MALDRRRDRARSQMGRLPGLDQRRRMARDGATGSEQDEHPAGLFDDTGPTREDVKSSEEATPCQTVRPDTGGGDLLASARIFSRHSVRLMRRVRGQRPEDRQRLRKNTPFSDIHERLLLAHKRQFVNCILSMARLQRL